MNYEHLTDAELKSLRWQTTLLINFIYSIPLIAIVLLSIGIFTHE